MKEIKFGHFTLSMVEGHFKDDILFKIENKICKMSFLTLLCSNTYEVRDFKINFVDVDETFFLSFKNPFKVSKLSLHHVSYFSH